MRVAGWCGLVGIVASVACGGAPESTMGDPAPGTPAAAAAREAEAPKRVPPVRLTVPTGTALSVRLGSTVSTDTAVEGDAVSGTVSTDVMADGRVAIPAGSPVSGSVTDVVRPGRVKGRSRLAVRFTSVDVRGDRTAIAAGPVVREGEATKSEDATKVGIGAGAGAAIGAILGGGKGAAKGAGIGAAGGTGVVLATRGKDVALEAGEPVRISLTEPIAVTVPAQ